jgi:hypothetical protein
MKKLIFFIILLIISLKNSYSQTVADTSVYLVTCGPGTDTYSIYGHSALRVVISNPKSDMVYNWGVFDFDTPHFAWKFAKGRLNYMISEESFQHFLQSYFYEERYVYSQKLNVNSSEKLKILSLINENMKPENIYYKYDFFYDNCSTRIRDLIEKSVGKDLIYNVPEEKSVLSFRAMINQYQRPYPWLTFGINLLIGTPAEKKVSVRDKMFLPLEMQKELSKSVIRRNGKQDVLLQNPEVVLDFTAPMVHQKFLSSPAIVFTIILIIVVILSSKFKKRKNIDIMDKVLLFIFSVLSLFMIFFNFFTDHQATKWNLNILWLNPLIIVCFVLLLLKKDGAIWFKTASIFIMIFLVICLPMPQIFNIGIIPLAFILLIRISARAGFSWNPFSLK